jgi:predicted enzyme related to lactoylglutathione lyase
MMTGTRAFIDNFRNFLGYTTQNQAEPAVRPADEDMRFEVCLLCDDIEATVAELKGKGVRFSRDITDKGWGLLTSISLPGGGEIGLYQPADRAEKPEG